jgi:predicted dienelactone hydrolase
VSVPVQLWKAEFDHVLPAPDYADAVQGALPKPPDFRVVAGADHYDFIPPCTARLQKNVPDICQSRPGFDRARFHARFDAEIVRFFQRALK